MGKIKYAAESHDLSSLTWESHCLKKDYKNRILTGENWTEVVKEKNCKKAKLHSQASTGDMAVHSQGWRSCLHERPNSVELLCQHRWDQEMKINKIHQAEEVILTQKTMSCGKVPRGTVRCIPAQRWIRRGGLKHWVEKTKKVSENLSDDYVTSPRWSPASHHFTVQTLGSPPKRSRLP